MSCFFELLYHLILCEIPLSLLIVRTSVPCRPWAWTKNRPVSWQELLISVILNFLCVCDAIPIIWFPQDVVEHWHEDDAVPSVGCSSVSSLSGSLLEWTLRKISDFFHSSSIASPSIPTASWYGEYILMSSSLPFHFSASPWTCSILPRHRTESA